MNLGTAHEYLLDYIHDVTRFNEFSLLYLFPRKINNFKAGTFALVSGESDDEASLSGAVRGEGDPHLEVLPGDRGSIVVEALGVQEGGVAARTVAELYVVHATVGGVQLNRED